MARVSPFLQMLLRPKRRLDIPYDNPNDEVDAGQPMDERGARMPSSPTVAIRPRAQAIQPVANETLAVAPQLRAQLPATDLAQQPTAPLANGDVAPVIPLSKRNVDVNAPETAAIPVKPRDIIAEDRDRLLAAQNKPHSKTKAVLEGLGTWAASGLGIPLQRMLHPGGTDVQKAQRQLETDLGIQKTQTENQDTQATIALRSAQARKIDADIQAAIDHPDTSDVDKQKLEVARDILRSHPQPFDPNDPQDAVAIKKITDAGIPIPQSYGKQPKEATPLFEKVKQPDGSVLTKKSVDGGKTWETVEDLTSAAPEKPEEGDVPDTTQGWIQLEANHRTNAANAQKAAEKAEADVKTYITQQRTADPNYDVTKDANVASLTAEARRQRDYAAEQLKSADNAAAKKVEAANADMKAGSKKKKPVLKGAAATHDFSISAYLKRNKGATEADARAYANQKYPDYSIVP